MIDNTELLISEMKNKAMITADDFNRVIAALEQSQQKEAIYDMLREDYGLDKKGVGLADFVDWQAKKIAELEASQLAVTLDSEFIEELETEANQLTSWHHMDEHSCKINRRKLLTLIEAIRAAGGTVQGNEND